MSKHIFYRQSTILLTLCAISGLAIDFVRADSQLQSALQRMKVSSDVLSVPSSVDTIKIELNKAIVKPGDSIQVKNFKDLDMGKINWDSSNFDARHTLLLLDIDRKIPPSSNISSIYNLFTSINIPASVINAGQAIVGFETPVVPCLVSPANRHRILMLTFHQPENIDITAVAHISAPSGQTSRRENFKLNEFINRNRLDLVAANVFYAAGEPNGVCSGTEALNSLVKVSPSILIAMVTSIIALVISGKQSLVN